MKVFINNRNYLTWPKAMAEKLTNDGHEVIIVDNNSTYLPLIQWYNDECPYQVIKLGYNGGCHAVWSSGLIKDINEYYAVTDADLDLSTIPSDWGEVLVEGLKKYNSRKCGFTLDETLIPEENPAWILDEFYKYPEGNHPARWGKDVYLDDLYVNYPIDTTFAVYDPSEKDYFIGGIRVGRPYTARHLPWHLVLNEKNDGKFEVKMNDEHYYYFTNTEGNHSQTRFRMHGFLNNYGK